ncbi:hypothetical protein E0H75_38610 [Kribbella capetownensis]|uniref:Uncharacterized protein n=1 Tax=Kribbella capetownensis TaxID=1572659 RepID=A0A4R0J3G6_9ACTN|nr:hypothetical protein [Kribbella capetownensis]TCC39990.1 hypothetical protein E0H75_38610 [Kribbella capetownensis]
MFEGALILESLRVGVEIADVPLVVRRISRYAVASATPSQAPVWSVLEFGVEDERAELLAETLAETLDQPGWYADFHDAREVFVVFPGRVFRYERGDTAARAEAQEFGRGLGIPEGQLDWTD